MSELKCVIFDWAGTTVDFGSMSPVEAFREAFRQNGLTVSDDEIRGPMGMLKRDHIKTMLAMPRIKAEFIKEHGREAADGDIDAIYGVFEPSLMSVLPACSRLKPYVKDAVKLLRDNGIKVGSTTGYTASMMETVTACAREQGYTPDCLVIPDEVANQGRPFPYMVFENLRRLGTASVREAVKIGDTFSDIAEGKNAGLFTVGVTEGSSVMGLNQSEFEALSAPDRERAHLKAAAAFYEKGADLVIRNLGELDLVFAAFKAQRC